MAATIKINIDPKTIILHRHLEKGGAAQRLFTNEVKRHSDHYTPMDAGILKSNVTVNSDSIVYNSIYAKYQYYGVSKNGKPLNYQGAPMRGKEWTTRMWIDKGKEITSSVAKFIGGKAIWL